MRKINLLVFVFLPLFSLAQETREWTEADRKLVLDNLIRSRDELLKETEGLSKQQWSFKESEERWSINQIVEHISFFEMIFDREISRGLGAKPQVKAASELKPDDYYTTFIMEEAVHVTTDFTKPFTYSVPLGLNDIKNNIAWFVKMRNESVEYVKTTEDNLRVYYRNGGNQDLHQTYLYVFGHVDRHLRQIRKVKQHKNYPKK